MSRRNKGRIWMLPAWILLLIVVYNCNRQEDRLSELTNARYYLNLDDSVEYVGMDACKECHYLIYKSYLRTGMGLSFDTANPVKSASFIGEDSVLYDRNMDLYLQPYWKNDSLMVKEFRKDRGDTVYERIEHVNYVVGSGQHTNSHIFLSGSYAYQAPFTYYTQKGMFDLPPGFEGGHNSRFSRKIGLECMSCHNGFPDMVLGSENKYNRIPDGIDCERCHGPGEIHVMLKKRSILVDTSRVIDYSIVNPVKLPKELQTDLCARCHLQGTMVLQAGRSFFDFKPGMRLHEVMDIFMPLFQGGKEDFIMASHYERMVQSNCFSASGGGFTCIDCHNPHISKRETPVHRYNRVCQGCHDPVKKGCSLESSLRLENENNCVECHMRNGPTRDIPHVTTHDHKISRPQTEEELRTERVFKGLFSVNNPAADPLTRARGYLLEYESYHPDPAYLDSSFYYLGLAAGGDNPHYFNALVNYHFLKHDYISITGLIEKTGLSLVLDSMLNKRDYSNYDAWTAYRIGQAYESSGNTLLSGYFYKKAVELAPYQLEFQAKHGSLLALDGKYREAGEVFEFILEEDPAFTTAWVNLGYVYLRQNQPELGKEMYRKALALNPDHLQALLNLAALLVLSGEKEDALKIIGRVRKIDPGNEHVDQMEKVLAGGH